MRVDGLWRFPVKSFQGLVEQSVELGLGGVEGDRQWGVVGSDGTQVLTAKRHRLMLQGETDGLELWWPDSERFRLPAAGSVDPELNAAMSAWLGVEVSLQAVTPATEVSYEMTFDPPNDDAEMVAIPAPVGSFVDLAPLHLLVSQTLAWCAQARPELDWDLRRFRPNMLLDVEGHEPFAEDSWVGRRIQVGTAALEVMQPAVRCAMPLRAQPGLDGQPAMYGALEELHANHLGLYVKVIEPGTVSVGDVAVMAA
ncbi:MAG: MOSC domain-containing protein [Microthrixaceae bacterium]|nr:MOSC domain-containing protein [Microthrixaceae bacterium]